MLRLPLAVVLLCLAAPSALAAQIVAGKGHFCLLDAEGAHCWSASGDQSIAPSHHLLPGAKRVWAGGDGTCVEANQGIVCWGKAASPTPTIPPGRALGLAIAGNGVVCAYLNGEGVRCFDTQGKMIMTYSGRPGTMEDTLEGWGRARPETLGASDDLVCMSYERGGTRCIKIAFDRSFRPFWLDDAFSTFRPRVYAQAQAGDYWCGIVGVPSDPAERRFACYERFVDRWMDDAGAWDLNGAKDLAASADLACLHDAEGVACAKLWPGEERRFLASRSIYERARVGHPDQLAVSGSTFCGLYGRRVRCYKQHASWPISEEVTRVRTPVDDYTAVEVGFALATLADDLDTAAAYFYEPEAAVIAATAAALRRADPDAADAGTAALALQLVRPLFEAPATPFIDGTLAPLFTRLATSLGPSPTGQGLDAAERTLALSVLAAALQQAADLESDAAVAGVYASAIAAAGRAIADGADAGAVARAAPAIAAAAAPLTDLAAGSHRGEGVALVGLVAIQALGLGG